MVDPTTTNRTFAIPTHGSDVDTWDQPVNANSALLDTILGAQGSVAATNGGTVVLNAAQLAFGLITVSGAIPANAAIQFPAVQGWWTIYNTTTGGILTITSAGSTESVAVPPGVVTDIQVIGTVVKFRNFPMIGSFVDYPSATVPTWITACTKAPFLLCDGSVFSAVTFPYLNTVLGGTTLPDFRGRAAYYLNGATSRLTAAGAGIDGSTLGAVGGNNGVNLAVNQVPTHSSVNAAQSITVAVPNGRNAPSTPGNVGSLNIPSASGGGPFPYTDAGGGAWFQYNSMTSNNSISVTYTNASLQPIQSTTPGIVGGIRMIRAG